MNQKEDIVMDQENKEPSLDSLNNEAEESPESSSKETIDSLKEEIDRLRAELEESRNANQKVAEDISEFQRLFPDVELGSIPEEVQNDVRSGMTLSASYALYEKRLEAERERIEAINRRNARRSSGAAGKNTQKEYFSPEDVRAMSQSEVRENYNKIINSMKKWN